MKTDELIIIALTICVLRENNPLIAELFERLFYMAIQGNYSESETRYLLELTEPKTYQ